MVSRRREFIRTAAVAGANISKHLDVLSGGAAKSLVSALQPAFMAATGSELRATFSAVGAMQEKLLAGEPCDVVILTAALIDALARDGHVASGTVAALGAVPTGVAVRAGDARPDVSDGDALRRSLAAASAIYVPDTERSTAGVHVVKVLRSLGIYADVAARLRIHANGATAMLELSRASEPRPIGITQTSEIIATPGIDLAGALPRGFDLATVYSVAVCTRAHEPALARRFAQLLASSDAGAARASAGFV
jgi:molybdate transport system substrate-binding protein